MLMEGIQSTKLSKIRSNSGDKPTLGVDAENKLETVYTMKYRINLDHQILTSSGVFYPQALDKDLIFELTLAHASQVVRGSNTSKLVYKLKKTFSLSTNESEASSSLIIQLLPTRMARSSHTTKSCWKKQSHSTEAQTLI